MIGPFMEGLYGGRSEVRIRLELCETMVADFRAQYSSVNVLMRLQEFLVAERVKATEGGPCGEAAQFLRTVTLDDLQRKETWPKLRGVALIRPAGDILPVRTVFHADHAQDSADRTLRAQQIGVNVVMSGPPTWYSFADVIASKILNGDRCPEILRTITLKPHGVQSGLKPIKFFGDPNYEIDLARDDLFQRVIDMRAEVKDDNPAMALSLKLLASATSFGATIEFIVDEHKRRAGRLFITERKARGDWRAPRCLPRMAVLKSAAIRPNVQARGLRLGGRSFRQAADCCSRLPNASPPIAVSDTRFATRTAWLLFGPLGWTKTIFERAFRKSPGGADGFRRSTLIPTMTRCLTLNLSIIRMTTSNNWSRFMCLRFQPSATHWQTGEGNNGSFARRRAMGSAT